MTIDVTALLIGMLVSSVVGGIGAMAIAKATIKESLRRPLGTFSPRVRLDHRVPPIHLDTPHKEDA